MKVGAKLVIFFDICKKKVKKMLERDLKREDVRGKREDGGGAVSARYMQGVCKAVSLLYRHFREFVTFLECREARFGLDSRTSRDSISSRASDEDSP